MLYAGLWEVFRTPHSLSSGGPGSGLFKSTDGGDDVDRADEEPGPAGRTLGQDRRVGVAGADANRVYAIIETDGRRRLPVGRRAARRGRRSNDDRRLRQRAFYYTRIYADPKERDTVYVLNTGFYRSTDAGKTFRSFRVPHGDNHDLWIAPNDPKRMINGNDGGANVSVNGGETLDRPGLSRPRSSTTSFTTAHVPYHVCGAQQDNSTACVSSAGDGELYAVGGGESGYIAPDPRNPDVFYAGSYGGPADAAQPHGPASAARINVWPDNPMGYSAADITERFQWTFPIVFAPTDPKTLYVGSQHVWKTTNEGQSWERISPDLTRHDPATLGPSGGPITLDQTGVETYATVFTLAPSPLDGRRHLGRLRRRPRARDARRRQDLDERHAAGPARLHAHQPDRGVAARRRHGVSSPANRYQRADRAPYVYKTDDYGKTWTKIVNGIAARRLRARDPRGPRSARACCISAPSTASTCRSTTAARGSRCA